MFACDSIKSHSVSFDLDTGQIRKSYTRIFRFGGWGRASSVKPHKNTINIVLDCVQSVAEPQSSSSSHGGHWVLEMINSLWYSSDFFRFFCLTRALHGWCQEIHRLTSSSCHSLCILFVSPHCTMSSPSLPGDVAARCREIRKRDVARKPTTGDSAVGRIWQLQWLGSKQCLVRIRFWCCLRTSMKQIGSWFSYKKWFCSQEMNMK